IARTTLGGTGSCNMGASVTNRSTAILFVSSACAISMTLLAPCEWPTKTSAKALPEARSLTILATVDFQDKCPIASAWMPLVFRSAASSSMPVENTPNQPRRRYTRVSAWAGLHQASTLNTMAATHLASNLNLNWSQTARMSTGLKVLQPNLGTSAAEIMSVGAAMSIAVGP